jgi:transcriptional pleiotropic regulator of transition state genes
MKATGITRKVDELGRIVLPVELRRVLHINDNDKLEVFVDEDKVILQKYEPHCLFTGVDEDLVEYEGRRVSKAAIQEMAKLAGLIE